jgi:uncharacterized protein
MKGRVVSNAGPIIAFSLIDNLEILERLFNEVIVPEAVHREIMQGGKEFGGLACYSRATWIKVETPDGPSDPLLQTLLDHGEASVIHLVRERGANFVLIDERKARKIARGIYGMHVVGSARVLVEAKRSGLISSVHDALGRMRDGGYWIHDNIVQAVLKQAGEE